MKIWEKYSTEPGKWICSLIFWSAGSDWTKSVMWEMFSRVRDSKPTLPQLKWWGQFQHQWMLESYRDFWGWSTALENVFPTSVTSQLPYNSSLKRTQWIWNEQHQKAFEALKQHLSNPPVLMSASQWHWCVMHTCHTVWSWCREDSLQLMPHVHWLTLKPGMLRLKRGSSQWSLHAQNSMITYMESLSS